MMVVTLLCTELEAAQVGVTCGVTGGSEGMGAGELSLETVTL